MFTNLQSGHHALCCALQIHYGLQVALDYCEPIWPGDGPGTLSGEELCDLLRRAGLPAVLWQGKPADILTLARGAYDGGYTVLMLVGADRPARGQGWGVYWGNSATEESVMECVGPEGAPRGPARLEDFFLGTMVVVEEEVRGPRSVTAFRGRHTG